MSTLYDAHFKMNGDDGVTLIIGDFEITSYAGPHIDDMVRNALADLGREVLRNSGSQDVCQRIALERIK